MKKKRDKNLQIVLIVLGAIALLVIASYFGTKSLVIGVQGVPTYQESKYWSAIDGEVLISAPFIGSYQDASRQAICGSNDGDFSASNNADVSNTMTLSTSFGNIKKRGCDDINQIKAEFDAPAGKLTINYEIKGSESNSEGSGGSVKVNDFSVGANWNFECNRGQSNINAGYWAGNCNAPKSGSETLVFDKPTHVVIELISYQGSLGSGSASATFSFQLSEIETIFYRIENNQCQAISLFPSQKMDSDYSTYNECVANIQSQGDNGSSGGDNGGSGYTTNINPVLIIIGLIMLGIILIVIYMRSKR